MMRLLASAHPMHWANAIRPYKSYAELGSVFPIPTNKAQPCVANNNRYGLYPPKRASDV